MNKIDVAKNALVDDLKDHPSSLFDPFGDNRTCDKLLEYLCVSVENGLSKSDIVDDLRALYKDQNEEERCKFICQVELVVKALMKYHTRK